MRKNLFTFYFNNFIFNIQLLHNKIGENRENSEPQGAKMYLNGEDTGRLTPCGS
jgi:hypothetical protein